MISYTATNILSILSSSSRKHYYSLEIASLDLDSNDYCGIPSKCDCLACMPAYEYLNLPCKPKMLLNQSYYSNCMKICLAYFMKRFKAILLKTLGTNLLKESVNDSEFFYELLTTKTSPLSEITLLRYMYVCLAIRRDISNEDVLMIYEHVAFILYSLDYDNSYLSFCLLRLISLDLELSPNILCQTESPEKLDYVIHHIQSHCNNMQCPVIFQLFKKKNSIIRCLSAGRPDLLEVLLKYGNWKSHYEANVYSETCIYFDEKFSILDFITSQHRLWRYFLMVQIYCAFSVSIELRNRYLSAIKLLWKTLPYPYIHANEMIANFIKVDMPPEVYHNVLYVIEAYRMCLCPRKLEPRSLKHYARCTIRFYLDQKSLLPDGIDSLFIPESCRLYLKLKD